MPPPRQRLVRKRPLLERIRGALNVSDFLLWASEEIQTRDLDSKPVGTRLALFCNFAFLLARANSGATTTGDDVFGEERFSWATLFAKQLVWLLMAGSVANALSLLYQKRHYRLFEANVEQKPSTPSAQRVRVQSTPVASSPLRLLADVMGSETAESRAHPDKSRDVWEVSVWDPIPACLQGVIFFSPLHVLMYIFELPLDGMDRRPSVTVFKCLVLQVCLSFMLQLLQSINDQRHKDAAIIQKEVFREYDTKFVHPRLHPLVRDVGIQASFHVDHQDGQEEIEDDIVEVGIPTTLIRRSFQTHPNPNYMKHIDPENVGSQTQAQSSNLMTPRMFTPAARSRHSESFAVSHQKSARRPRQSMPAVMHTPVTSTSTSTMSTGTSTAPGLPSPGTATTNFNGSLGVYSHASSPLKKATSLNDIGSAAGFASPRHTPETATTEQRGTMDHLQRSRGASPLKQQVTTAGSGGAEEEHSVPNFVPAAPVNPFLKNRPSRHAMERYPSRW